MTRRLRIARRAALRVGAAALTIAWSLWLLACPAAAVPARARPTAEPGWAADRADVRAAVEAGAPLVVHVTVPLCNGHLIDCGSKLAGRPADLAHNVYWGAIFGARRFLERKRSGWERVGLQRGEPPVLERVALRRVESGAPWGLEKGRTVELIVVLDAFHGEHHDDALRSFHERATRATRVALGEGEGARALAVHAAGWAGHNRMMDGVALPEATEGGAGGRAAFVLACDSHEWFAPPLERAGVALLVSTHALMAPEGYVIDAVLRGLAANEGPTALRRRTAAAYARWQRLSPGVARWIFR